MTAVFLKILNMSITGAVIAAAVLLLRPLLKRAPRALVCALWLLVGLRLLLPFTFESPLSLMPANDTVTESSDGSISVNTGIGFINSAFSTPQTPPQSITLPEGFTPPTVIPDSGEPNNGAVTVPETEEDHAGKSSVSAVDIAAIVWASGTVLMVIYAAVSYLRIRLRVRESVKVEKGIFICDRIDSPFILGVIRPRIYMPSDTPEGDTPYIISHERAHLKRLDHLWKPLGFLLLSLHWFNPVMWVSYIMLCRDIELACDEKVIRAMGEEAKKPYSDALISASSPRRLISACPLAFGEVGVKRRIRAVLSYKKPTLWIIIAAVLALCIVAACFLTSRKADENEPPFCIEAQNSYSDMDGVWAEITKTDTENGKMTVVWHNDTENELVFGDEFYIYRIEESGQTVDTYTFSEEYAWNLIGYPVVPGGTFEKEYSVAEHEIQKDTPHRYDTYFHIDGSNPVPDGLKKYALSIDFVTRESFIPESTKPAESDTPDLPTPDLLNNIEKIEAADDVKCTITFSGYNTDVIVEGDEAKALYRDVASNATGNEKHFNVPTEQQSIGLSFTVNGFENSYYFRVFDNDTVQTELPIHTTTCKGYTLKSGTYEKVKAMVKGYFDGVVTPSLPNLDNGTVIYPTFDVYGLGNGQCAPSYVISEDSHLYKAETDTDFVDLGKLTKVTLTKKSFVDLFNSEDGRIFYNLPDLSEYPWSAEILFENISSSWMVLNSNRNEFYILSQRDNKTYYLSYGFSPSLKILSNGEIIYDSVDSSILWSYYSSTIPVCNVNYEKAMSVSDLLCLYSFNSQDDKYFGGDKAKQLLSELVSLSRLSVPAPQKDIDSNLAYISVDFPDGENFDPENITAEDTEYYGSFLIFENDVVNFTYDPRVRYHYSQKFPDGTYEKVKAMVEGYFDGVPLDPDATKPAESDTPDLPSPDMLNNIEKVEAADDVKCTITLSGYTKGITVEGNAAKALYREVASSINDNEKYFNVPSEQPSVGLSFTVNGFENSYYFRVFDDDTVQTELPVHTTICKGYALKSGSYEKIKAMVEGYFDGMPEIHMNLHTFPSTETVLALDNFACVVSLDGYDSVIVKDGVAKALYFSLVKHSNRMQMASDGATGEKAIYLSFLSSDNISTSEHYLEDAHYYGVFHIGEEDIVSTTGSPYMSYMISYSYPAGTYEEIYNLVSHFFYLTPVTGTDDPENTGYITRIKYYTCEDSREVLEPSITLLPETGRFSFTYSYLSSYLVKGKYELSDTKLTLRTDDGLYTYVFNRVSGGFEFDAEDSSPLPKYKYSADDTEALPPFDDGAVFKSPVIN